jgi:hypothetical protein
MSIDFSSILSADQKRQLLEGRIAQFAGEAYQYGLNLKTAEKVGSEEQIESIKQSLSILEAAIGIHQEELAGLPPKTEEQ